MRAPPAACDVLVVGLGPVGLLLTALLARHGCDVVAVERDPAPSPLPRAATLDDEALRAVQAAGIAAPGIVLDEAELRLLGGRCVTLMRMPRRTANGHPALVGLHQPDLEAGLEASVRERAFRGWELGALRDDGGGVSARVGAAHTIRARWVVGCDGARSRVRALAGIPFPGRTFAQRWLVVDESVAEPGPRRVTFVGDPAAPAVTLPLTAALRRWEVMVDAGAPPDPGPGAVRTSVYAFHARTAGSWRSGRVLLAGDAAHVMPPFAGQGLGAGLRDAVNLAWKLAAVAGGRAGAELLDTYERERRPHVTRMTALARFVGAIVQTRRRRVALARDRTLLGLAATPAGGWLQGGVVKPRATLPRGRLVGASPGAGALIPQPDVIAAGGARVPLDDLLGPGWALLAREPVATTRAGVRTAVLGRDLADPGGTLDAWLAARGAAFALVRPDRHVLVTGASARDAAAALGRLDGLA